MKKSSIVLFSLRLFFYFSVIGLILFHQNIIVSYDYTGWILWFIIIPIEALIAFLPVKIFKLHVRCIIALLVLLPLSIIAGGFIPGLLSPFFAGLLSFVLTFLLFHYPRWAKIAVLEPFFLAWVGLRLLALSRSGEDIAGQDLVFTQFIFVWTAVVFLLHSVVIYFCLYPQSTGGALKEGAVFLFAALIALVLALVVLPPDFVRNTVIENLRSERIPKEIGESAKGIPEASRGEGRNTIPQGEGGEGQSPSLRGISEYEWPGSGQGGRGGNPQPGSGSGDRGRNGSGDSRQYLVMVVASKHEPVYMGDVFNGQLNPVEGFVFSQQEPLNSLAYQRFFVTWFNNERNNDRGRRQLEVFSLSTLRSNHLPYYPVSVDPTILSEDSGPLRYIHQVVSNMHTEDPLELIFSQGRPLSAAEKNTLAQYLELPLYKDDLEEFSSWLKQAQERWQLIGERFLWNNFPHRRQLGELNYDNEFMQTILAILTNFSSYQYDLNYGNNTSIAALKDFLFDNNVGNCVEFSNSVALLGRIAGIPSRVVTGYLAAEGLQNDAHLQGLAVLQEKIPILQQFPFNDLYMVTDVHAHSWVQFYIPDYGWLDFEATTFAIPPMGGGNIGTWDVVIPLIDENKVFSPIRKIPWGAIIRVSLILAGLALISAYVLRYGREQVLFFGAKRGGREGARSLYLLLLARLAADGKPIKPASKTALEYAELFPGTVSDSPFTAFAALYSELRWREFKDASERDERFSKLQHEYRNILKTTRRRGFFRVLVRLFSLRGLAYL